MRERGGRTLAQVLPAEADAVAAVRLRVAKGTVVHADESPAWNTLHAGFAMLLAPLCIRSYLLMSRSRPSSARP